MPLTLRDGVYWTRTTIGELVQRRWSDAQIIYDLNRSAQDLCSTAQTLTEYCIIPVSNVSQEGPLPVEADQIKAVKYFAGQLYDLEPKDWKDLQSGAFTGSQPIWFYVKTATLQLTPQTIGSNIVETDLLPENPAGNSYQTVVGCWPIPEVTTEGQPSPQLQVWYSYFHTLMQEPQSICAVPSRFLETWAAKAISHCLRIEKAYSEADMWESKYQQGKEEYRIWAMTHNQVRRPARYGVNEPPWRNSASSSVILVDQTPLMTGA